MPPTRLTDVSVWALIPRRGHSRRTLQKNDDFRSPNVITIIGGDCDIPNTVLERIYGKDVGTLEERLIPPVLIIITVIDTFHL
jgi:hypothetical protein